MQKFELESEDFTEEKIEKALKQSKVSNRRASISTADNTQKLQLFPGEINNNSDDDEDEVPIDSTYTGTIRRMDDEESDAEEEPNNAENQQTAEESKNESTS